jgi:hypothetical protein
MAPAKGARAVVYEVPAVNADEEQGEDAQERRKAGERKAEENDSDTARKPTGCDFRASSFPF